MDYFRIKQDRRYLHVPTIGNLNDIIKRRSDIAAENASNIDEINVGFSNSSKLMEYTDVLDSQLFLISCPMRDVFQIYEGGMVFKDLCILNNLTGEHGDYCIPFFREIDCMSNRSIVSPDKSYIKRLVITSPPEDCAVFKIGGLQTDAVLIRLDVAESLFRRNIRKFSLERVEMEKEGSDAG